MLSTTLSGIATIIFIGLMAIYLLSKIKLFDSKKERIKNKIYCQLKKNHNLLAILFLGYVSFLRDKYIIKITTP